MKAHNGASHPYTTQSCEYFHPVPFFYASRHLLVCEGSALTAIVTVASSSSSSLKSSTQHRGRDRAIPKGRMIEPAAPGSQDPVARTVVLFFFSIPFIISPFCFSLPPSRNSDPGSHSRLLSPLPTTVRALHFYRENISALSSLVDSRRIVLTHARRPQQLILVLFYFCK